MKNKISLLFDAIHNALDEIQKEVNKTGDMAAWDLFQVLAQNAYKDIRRLRVHMKIPYRADHPRSFWGGIHGHSS